MQARITKPSTPHATSQVQGLAAQKVVLVTPTFFDLVMTSLGILEVSDNVESLSVAGREKGAAKVVGMWLVSASPRYKAIGAIMNIEKSGDFIL